MLGVRDTGTGMSPEVQAHLFEPFFTTKGVGKGTGLGLATVYGIVKQHGGYIRIESARGRRHGREDLSRARRAGAGRRRPYPRPTRRRPSDRAPCSSSRTRARCASWPPKSSGSLATTVLSAGSPSAALEIAQRHPGPIHLLLTDVVMPEMSGRDLADHLVRARPGLKILYMSGYTDDAIVHHGVLDPGTVLLQKPFTPDRLTRMVGDLLA